MNQDCIRVCQNTDGDTNQDMEQDIGYDMGENVDGDANQDMEYELDQRMDQHMGTYTGNDNDQVIGQESDQNVTYTHTGDVGLIIHVLGLLTLWWSAGGTRIAPVRRDLRHRSEIRCYEDESDAFGCKGQVVRVVDTDKCEGQGWGRGRRVRM